MAEILAIADAPRRFASWYGGFDTELQPRVLSGAMRDEFGDGGLARIFHDIVAACRPADSALRSLPLL